MTPFPKRPFLLLLSNFLFFYTVSLFGEAAHTEREKILDKEIIFLYQELSRARELLRYEKIMALPSNTNVSFIGAFPNRTGIKIKKFNIETDSGNRGKIKLSEEKSILIEFNGSVLSKIEVFVSSEDVQIQQKSKTIILERSPLDDNLNDLEINFNGLNEFSNFKLADLKNDENRQERNDFKQDFYIKFLSYFHSQISRIIASQKERGVKVQKTMLKQLNGSLNY